MSGVPKRGLPTLATRPTTAKFIACALEDSLDKLIVLVIVAALSIGLQAAAFVTKAIHAPSQLAPSWLCRTHQRQQPHQSHDSSVMNLH
jgi:hypothetical protein